MALGLKFFSQLREVVYFAVVGEPNGFVFVAQRLDAASQIDDSQSSMCQAAGCVGRVDVKALSVRPAMRQNRGHALEQMLLSLATTAEV